MVSHHTEHIKLYTFTPPKMPSYRALVVETAASVPSLRALKLASIISKAMSRPLTTNVRLIIRGDRVVEYRDEELTYAVHLLASTAAPIYLNHYEPHLQILLAYVRMAKGAEPVVYAAALVTKQNVKKVLNRATIFVPIFKEEDKVGIPLINKIYMASWNLLLYRLQLEATERVPPYVRVLLVLLKERGDRDSIVVHVPEAHENIRVQVPICAPQWNLEDLPARLREDLKTVIVNPILSKVAYAPRGILITGPPGVGKSVTAEAIAHALNLKVVELRPTLYRSMWYGLTEKILDSILREVKKKRGIMVLMDDVDFLVGRHISIHETHISEVVIFLKYLQDPTRPLIVMTTNTPEVLDAAMIRPGRIDVVVLMGYPDRDFRKQVALRSARRYGIEIDEALLDTIANMTRWFTHAEIDALIRLAASVSKGKVNEDAILWARKKFNINESARKAVQDRLRWFGEQFQGIVLKYVPQDSEIV